MLQLHWPSISYLRHSKTMGAGPENISREQVSAGRQRAVLQVHHAPGAAASRGFSTIPPDERWLHQLIIRDDTAALSLRRHPIKLERYRED
jgi:hypothetical protein